MGKPGAKAGWDDDEVGSKAGPRAGDWPVISRLIRWRHYDVAFGLALPVACFALEFVLLPALGWLPGLVFFHRYRLFGYGVVAFELATLAAWLRFGSWLGRRSAPVAGVLLAGSLFAGALGLVLLPFAVPGVLAFGIGLLGFVPLFTSHVYYRNGLAAYRQAESQLGQRAVFEALAWGAILVYGIPGLIQARVSLTARAALREVIGRDGPAAQAAVERLRPYQWVADFDPLRRACLREPDRDRWERLARAYRDLTGRDVRFGADRLLEYDGPDRLFED